MCVRRQHDHAPGCELFDTTQPLTSAADHHQGGALNICTEGSIGPPGHHHTRASFSTMSVEGEVWSHWTAVSQEAAHTAVFGV